MNEEIEKAEKALREMKRKYQEEEDAKLFTAVASFTDAQLRRLMAILHDRFHGED